MGLKTTTAPPRARLGLLLPRLLKTGPEDSQRQLTYQTQSGGVGACQSPSSHHLFLPDQDADDPQAPTACLLSLFTWLWHHQCWVGVKVGSVEDSEMETYDRWLWGREVPWPGQWEALSCGAVVMGAQPTLPLQGLPQKRGCT